MNIRPEDLVSSWGDCFANAVAGVVDGLSNQDAYEVWAVALDCELTLAALKEIDEVGLERLKDATINVLEVEGCTSQQMRKAVDDTIWHYA